VNAASFAQAVRQRAGERCEYCRMHQSLQGATFHVEHVVPMSRGGPTALENLAWCCPSCNLHKSDRTHASDRDTGDLVPLFHPRQDDWNQHFAWQDHSLSGITPTGRATIAALKLNAERRLLIRQAEARFGLFPPDS
jgi:hypothetical protein